MFYRNPRTAGKQTPHQPSYTPMMIASAIYLVMGLATLGNFHDATIAGVGYVAMSVCYWFAYGRS